ncbi:MAG: hypothetical protein GVY20_00475 [Bacteroidetes bacterium]|jgi:hypothetical protein|nr:hypothetical protein [Bacteroidota bacterium]
MTLKYLFTALLSILFLSQVSFAQDLKEEVENSIDKDEMPASALDALEDFLEDQIVTDANYYRETDGETTTFEAKLYWQDYQYSIEFTDEGLLLDIEQLIEFNEIPEGIQGRITQIMEEQFSRFRMTRVQRQYISDEEDEDGEDVIEDFLENDMDDLIVRYEIEVEGQNRSEMGSFEMLFDPEGELIQRRRIVRRSIDNIW